MSQKGDTYGTNYMENMHVENRMTGGDRISNQSAFNRPSFNRPSAISQQSNRFSFPSFNFEQGNQTGASISNRQSTQSMMREETHESTTQPQQSTQQQACTCTKSKCLKLYCICFQNQRLCGPTCRCIDCCNTENHEQQRQYAMQQILARNPEAFKNQIDAINIKKQPQTKLEAGVFQQPPQNNIFNNSLVHQQHQFQTQMANSALQMKSVDPSSQLASQQVVGYKKGCNCRKTHCLKKYCECYNAGFKCHQLCKCDDCHNREMQMTGDEMETEDDKRHQNLMLIEQQYSRQKMIQQMSIQEQRSFADKQNKVNLVGKGIVD